MSVSYSAHVGFGFKTYVLHQDLTEEGWEDVLFALSKIQTPSGSKITSFNYIDELEEVLEAAFPNLTVLAPDPEASRRDDGYLLIVAKESHAEVSEGGIISLPDPKNISVAARNELGRAKGLFGEPLGATEWYLWEYCS